MWDIIFQPVPGVFSCPFQTSPLDIDTPFFYAAREPEIIARINSIKGGLAMELIRSVYHRHHRVQCRDVTWFPLETIIEIVKCMSPAALSGIVSIQAKTHWAYSSGGPDLVIWNPDTCQLRMIEVKSANDTLSDNQHVWLATLASFGVDTLVLNIKPRTT